MACAQVDAVKGICFKSLPRTLCIHLKRFEYDYEQMTRWKIKDRWVSCMPCEHVHIRTFIRTAVTHHHDGEHCCLQSSGIQPLNDQHCMADTQVSAMQ